MEIIPFPRPIAGWPPPFTAEGGGERRVEGREVSITCLATGEGHTLMVTDGGRRVWAWGSGSSGQLGVGRKGRRKGWREEEEEEEEEEEYGKAALGSCR